MIIYTQYLILKVSTQLSAHQTFKYCKINMCVQRFIPQLQQQICRPNLQIRVSFLDVFPGNSQFPEEPAQAIVSLCHCGDDLVHFVLCMKIHPLILPQLLSDLKKNSTRHQYSCVHFLRGWVCWQTVHQPDLCKTNKKKKAPVWSWIQLNKHLLLIGTPLCKSSQNRHLSLHTLVDHQNGFYRVEVTDLDASANSTIG